MGIRLIPKLKQEHISLTAFSKMRVDLAAQVLHVYSLLWHSWKMIFSCMHVKVFSSSVSNALPLVCGDKAKETAHFCGAS